MYANEESDDENAMKGGVHVQWWYMIYTGYDAETSRAEQEDKAFMIRKGQEGRRDKDNRRGRKQKGQIIERDSRSCRCPSTRGVSRAWCQQVRQE